MRIHCLSSNTCRIRLLQTLIAIAGILLPAAPLLAQATAHPCGTEPATAGPACLLAHVDIRALPTGSIYWHLDTFPSDDAANAANSAHGTVVKAFDTTWLFTLAARNWRAASGRHMATIGPLPVMPASSYSAEFLRSVFTPGMTAPLHVHSGPEAFYALHGDTCLETPDGVQRAIGDGHWIVIRGGPPMLLMATGTESREGFALILHDAKQPPTTMIHTWQPRGLCHP